MDKLPDELIRKILSYNIACIFSKDCGLCFSNTYYLQFLKCKLLDYKESYITGKYKNIDILKQTCYVLNSRKKCPFCMGYTENMICKISTIIFNIFRYENCYVKIYPTPYWEVLDFDTKEELQDCLKLMYKCQKVKIKMFNYQKYIDYCLDNKGIKIRPKLEYNLKKLCSTH
tara:strand:+ start:36 stop:551 length:516 start_codon:yes stop_codon:yes gene_type:complete